jgi:hydroxybutyrate-dimer hydrolase
MLPYVYAALDQVSAKLGGEGKWPGDAVIAPVARGAGAVELKQFAIPAPR